VCSHGYRQAAKGCCCETKGKPLLDHELSLCYQRPITMRKYKVAFVWRFQTPNCGDLVSSPWNYLYFLRDAITRIDISRDLKSKQFLEIFDNVDAIIVGGGGLLGLAKYMEKIEFIVDKYHEKTFIWGAGSNWPRLNPPGEIPQINKCFFSGIRDFPLSVTYQDFPMRSIEGTTYLPCASVLDMYFLSYWKGKILNKKKPLRISKNSRRSLKILFSSNDAGKQSQSFPSSFMRNIELALSKHFDCTITTVGNSNVKMLACLDAIQSADLIFTRSYHFAYWSFLLGKPVIALPTSSKFNSFPSDHNRYLLFSSCQPVLEYISSSTYSEIAEFVFTKSHHGSIHYYLQSVLLNLAAAYCLYAQLKDIDSYNIFASKYNDLLNHVPSKIFNEIGIFLNKSKQSIDLLSGFSKNSFTMAELQQLKTLYSGRALLADNAMNDTIQLYDHSVEDQRLYALRHIQLILNYQLNYLISFGLRAKFKRRISQIFSFN